MITSKTVPLIDTERALRDLCREISAQPWFALDTEFMRERTYYSQLCLVQIASPALVACVDPLRIGALEPLLEVLYAPRAEKVIHSARQDLELFFDLRGSVPSPIFDTQIAAALLGYDEQIGYGNLVEAITGIRLPKAHTRADWAARPLSSEQLRYAADDVVHLRDVYRDLAERLRSRNRLGWLREECARLEDPDLYRNSTEALCLRIKQAHTLNAAGQQRLRDLVAWREAAARARNLPRSWVLRDEELMALARAAPRERAHLRSLLGADLNTAWVDELLAIVGTPRPVSNTPILWEQPPRFSPAQTQLLKSMTKLAETRAREQEVSLALLAPRRDLKRLALGQTDVGVLHGWRRTVLGEDLLRLL